MNDWISVKDRLPEILIGDSSENVLISCDEGIFVACLSIDRANCHRKTDEYCWEEQSTGCGCCSSIIKPTHWMPLPKQP